MSLLSGSIDWNCQKTNPKSWGKQLGIWPSRSIKHNSSLIRATFLRNENRYQLRDSSSEWCCKEYKSGVFHILIKQKTLSMLISYWFTLFIANWFWIWTSFESIYLTRLLKSPLLWKNLADVVKIFDTYRSLAIVTRPCKNLLWLNNSMGTCPRRFGFWTRFWDLNPLGCIYLG